MNKFVVSFRPLNSFGTLFLGLDGQLTARRAEARVFRKYADADENLLRSAGRFGNGDWRVDTH
jgi:hypothetical protein